MDESDKENSPEPAQLKRFGLVEGESVLPTDSIASLAMRTECRRAWSETNSSWECQGSFVASAMVSSMYHTASIHVLTYVHMYVRICWLVVTTVSTIYMCSST